MENIVTVKVNKQDLVNSKFTKTISTVEGYFKEAKGDLSISQTYSATAVYNRMADIRNVLMEDLEKLSHDIAISHNES
jgi:hypothetical protein